MEQEKRILFITFGFSMLCHLFFFGLMLFWPSRSPAIRFKVPSAIQVKMVTLPAPVMPPANEPATQPEPALVKTPESESVITPPPEIKPETPKQKIITPEKKETEVEIKEPEKIVDKPPKHLEPKVKPKPAKVLAEIVSLTPQIKTPKPKSEPKPKKSLKQKTQKFSNDVQRAIEKLKTPNRKASYASVKTTLDDIKRKLGNNKEAGAPKQTNKTYGGPSQGKFSPALAGQLNIYKYALADSIAQNWAFNPSLAGGGADLEVQLLVKIMANGRIESIKVIKQSGNDMLDESAFRAIKKSDPLSHLPKGLPYYEIVMGFGPSGLN